MGVEEAIKGIMEALGDSVSDFDKHFGVINDAIKSAAPPEDGSSWEQKYNDLKQKYIDRFSKEFSMVADREGDYVLDDATDGSPAVKLEDLDFDASTE